MIVLRHADVAQALHGREAEMIDAVATAYRLHELGESALPHSTFLRFPGDGKNRIIGLPAYLGGDEATAGMKWIASFPGNLEFGLERASASILLNSLRTGRPEALIEGSQISAKRTAAGAALAARLLSVDPAPTGISLIGCGVINFEVLRFCRVALPSLTSVTVMDRDPARASTFADRARSQWPDLSVTVAAGAAETLAAHPLISIATTASEPHLDLAGCAPASTVLHVSLRDLTVQSVLAGQNIVDDADHVCRERTSLHLAQLAVGHRAFIDAPIGRILAGRPFRRDPDRIAVFSPFGLGILDVALARLARAQARLDGLGVEIEDFLPAPVSVP
jgi:2,3-diaminopropionate biosynthesis protein SbnB